MRLIRVKDYEELSAVAARIIAAQVTLKPDCVLGLATGSSPEGTYKQLIAAYERGELATYPTELLELYAAYLKDLKAQGRSLAVMIQETMVRLYGYKTIDEAEARL